MFSILYYYDIIKTKFDKLNKSAKFPKGNDAKL
jgi:hypothetical protein